MSNPFILFQYFSILGHQSVVLIIIGRIGTYERSNDEIPAVFSGGLLANFV